MKRTQALRSVLCFALLLGLLVGLFPAPAALAASKSSGSCGKNLSWKLKNGVLTISGSGKMKEYSEEKPAPWPTDRVEKVKIKEGVATIGSFAFYDCGELTSVSIPASVTRIGDYAFSGCWLESVEIPEGVAELGDGAFAECFSLSSVSIPASVASVGINPFYYCAELKSIEVAPENPALRAVGGVLLSEGGERLVSYPCGSKRAAYTVPDGVTAIGESAFCDCGKLASVTLPDSVKRMEEGAFSYCRALQSVELPAGLTRLEDRVFQGCISLASIGFPAGLRSERARSSPARSAPSRSPTA